MFEIVPLELAQLKSLVDEPMNAELSGWWETGAAKKLWEQTESFAILVDGEVMVCGGICPMWVGRGYLWTVLSEKIKQKPVSVYRGIKAALKEQPYRRIEMDVPVNHEIAHRRAKLLGFTLECPEARGYLPNGEARSIYAWVRE